MLFDAVSGSSGVLAAELRRAAARLEAIARERSVRSGSVTEGWEGPTRVRFDQERTRQSALAAHLIVQSRRLAAELDAA